MFDDIKPLKPIQKLNKIDDFKWLNIKHNLSLKTLGTFRKLQYTTFRMCRYHRILLGKVLFN